MTITTDGIDKWNLATLDTVFEIATERSARKADFGATLDAAGNGLKDWEGKGGDAFRQELGKHRVDITDQQVEATAIANAFSYARSEVEACKTEWGAIKSAAASNNWSISPTGQLSGQVTERNRADFDTLQRRLTKLMTEANQTDRDLATAIRAVVGDTKLTPDGRPIYGPPMPKDETKGKETPADQLPLPAKNGQVPSPTEATAGRHDHPELGGSDYLATNPNPSPLLSGLSAQEWRDRLANFKPGDPLPDPRTPTGDPAIDSLAHAASQQNTTYAWGGNKSPDGPSVGQGDEGDGANQFHDWDRYGYDCGGLVRYSVQQGAGFDTGMGTDAIDTNPTFTQSGGNVPSSAIAGNAQTGDVLVFGGVGGYQGGATQHTGIYIGNGYMMEAPGSGSPVSVGGVSGHGSADILRLP
ncbi:C40 family peptidase [Mycolicibacter virginiensis]|uniref:C40 family peptidase n=1 Tax=Mycolicibacter virginiensis TaxID=1795032 RepID=UPI001F03B15E|nr:NlpC/P60 family protein [Mycolicibacter virginiensis]ULP48034.1 NlpC/P60 family protein [Mycolicibacter virginiensis]